MEFSNEEKCAVFDKIEKNYFIKNFGSMSKTDFETLLFSEYIEHCMKNGLPYDDYSLSKVLGITQSRIRALKERKELKYPSDGEARWKELFAESVQNAKYDSNDHYIKMIIQDVNVMNEVRHFIESKGWYDECSLNKKLLRIPMDCFVEIFYEKQCFEAVFSEDVKESIKKLKNADNQAVKEFLIDFSKEGLKEFLMNASKEVIGEVIKLLPFGDIAKTAFDYFVPLVQKK